MKMTRVYLLTAAAETHPGRKRANNEDYVAFFEPTTEQDLMYSGALYIVADGVGGAAKGERASQFAAQKVLYEYYQRPHVPPPERLAQIMQEVGNEIYRFSQSKGRFTRMATTMVAAAFVGQRLFVANVGDSRAYLLRHGRVRQITHDHNVVGEMVRGGILTEEEALRSKVKNRLTRSLGGEPNPQVDLFEVTLQPGDRILLCSDGLTRYALREDIAQMAGHGTPQEVVQRLIDFANQRGGADNISVILIEVGPEVTPRQWVLQKAQQQQPPLPEVDLETIVAQPVVAARATRRRRWWEQPPFNDRRLWALGLVAFVLSCGLGILGVGMIVRSPRPASGSGTLGASITIPASAMPESTETEIQAGGVSESPTVLAFPPTLTPTPIPTTPIPTSTLLPTSASAPTQSGCFTKPLASYNGSVFAALYQTGLIRGTAASNFKEEYLNRYGSWLYYVDQDEPGYLQFLPLPEASDPVWNGDPTSVFSKLSGSAQILLPFSREACNTYGLEWKTFGALPESVPTPSFFAVPTPTWTPLEPQLPTSTFTPAPTTPVPSP